ncbi:MAG: rubredoxin [Cyclobacteriaceae bacterium]
MLVKDLVRVFVKGGIISPGDMLKILLTAEKLGASHIHLGSRQDILFAALEKNKTILDQTFSDINTHYEVNAFEYQNIVSSYVSQDIIPGKRWLASHIYHYVLDSFEHRTRFRVNVVDPIQSLVPFFTGNVNFIASNQENYWYVYLRFEELHNEPWQMPLLVYTEDLVKIARTLEDEDLIHQGLDYSQIFDFLTTNVKLNTQPVTENLILPETHFPYYEGINRLPDGKYWLGLYWRDNKYKISILKAIMERCISTDVGKITLSPWKSFVIKGIDESERIGWEKLMGKFGMNMRHSSLELNWHLPALDEEAMDLKFYLVRELDKQDVSTYGLTFTIKTSDDITLFTSVVIEKSKEEGLYNILHSKGFNPNTNSYQIFAENVPKSVLASLILELSLVYYENLLEPQTVSPKVKSITDKIQKELYQCVHCQTVYDEEYGDEEQGISGGTAFKKLPSDYTCPTCGGKKTGFKRMKLE